MDNSTSPPKVFISYSWDDEENNNHKNWVLKLATDLVHHGVDVILDQWDARLGNDLAFFMEQGLTNSQLVICVCSERYTEKANNQRGGVGYEKRIMSADLISEPDKDYLIPIVRNNPLKVRPTFLKSLKYADFSNDSDYISSYSELLARIHNEDLKQKPTIGENPFRSSKLSEQISMMTQLQSVEFCNPASEGTIEFDYKRNSGIYTIGEVLYTFKIAFSECGYDSIYSYRDHIHKIGYNPKHTDFPKYNELTDFDYTSRCKSLLIGEVLILENIQHHFAVLKILEVRKNKFDIGHLVRFSYKIYKDNSIQ